MKTLAKEVWVKDGEIYQVDVITHNKVMSGIKALDIVRKGGRVLVSRDAAKGIANQLRVDGLIKN